MPITYRIDRTRRIVFTSIEGQIALKDCLAYYEQLRSDRGFDPNFHVPGVAKGCLPRLSRLRTSLGVSRVEVYEPA